MAAHTLVSASLQKVVNLQTYTTLSCILNKMLAIQSKKMHQQNCYVADKVSPLLAEMVKFGLNMSFRIFALPLNEGILIYLEWKFGVHWFGKRLPQVFHINGRSRFGQKQFLYQLRQLLLPFLQPLQRTQYLHLKIAWEEKNRHIKYIIITVQVIKKFDSKLIGYFGEICLIAVQFSHFRNISPSFKDDTCAALPTKYTYCKDLKATLL